MKNEYLTDESRDDSKQIAAATKKMNPEARKLVLKFARDILLFSSMGYELREIGSPSI